MSMKDIRRKETAAHRKADAKLGEKIKQVMAESKGWFNSAMDKLAGIGQSQAPGLVRTASAEKPTGPAMAPQMSLVARTNERGSVRSLDLVVAEQKRVAETHTRSIENAVARGRDMIAKVASELKMAGADILYIRSDISRWDDKTGEPQTGRLSFQVPFESESGASRTIYADVDIVMGDLLPPRYFQDGLNKRYAFDESGITELMEGMEFEILQNPHVTPDTKYRGPDMFPPSDIPSSVAGSRGGQFIHRHASGDMVRTASSEKPPKRVGEGLVRAISKEALAAEAQDVHMPPTTPEEIEAAMRKKQVKQPSDAISAYPSGKEHGTGYVGENHGSDQTPAAITMSDDTLGMPRAAEGEMPPEGPRRPRFRRPMRGPKQPQAEKLEGIQWNEEPGEGTTKRYAGTASHGHYAAEVGENYAQIEKMGEGTKSKHNFKSPQEAQKFAQEYWGISAAEAPPEGGGMTGTASLNKKAAGGWDEVVECLKYYDVRQLNYADLVQYLKAHGQEKDLTYEEAAKKLMGEGIVLYRIAGTEKASALGVGMLIRLMALDSRRQIQAQMEEGMPGVAPNPSAKAGPETGTDVPPDFEISRYLEPVEYKEYDALLDKWESLWNDIQSRERQNLEQGQEAHANLDYAEVQILADQIKATQSLARERHDTEGMPAPADVSMDDQTERPEDLEEPVSPAQEAPGQSIAPATLKPEKGRGQAAPQMGMGASVAPGMVRKAATADDLNNHANEVNEMLPNLKDEGNATPGKKGAGKGQNPGYPQAGKGMPELARQAVTVEMTEPVKEKMRAMELDPNNPEHQDQFVSTVKKVQAFKKDASQSLDFPEVCKNCKWLMTPVGYSSWTEYKNNRLPTCGAPKSQSVGFEYAWFRECASYDPIAKDIPQKIESISTKSDQTDADIKKVTVPIKQKAEIEKKAGEFAAPGSVAEEDVHTLLEDLDAFMDAFTYEDTEPVHVGEGDPGEEDTERQIQQQVQQARETKDPGAIRAALREMSDFLGLFSGPNEAELQLRVTEALESSMPEEGMSPFEDVQVDDSDLEQELAPDKPGTISEQSPEAGENGAIRTAEALPSADADAVRSRDSGNGASNEVREWCKANGHYAPAGEHHPTHDWCTLWNRAVEDIVILPSGAGVPKSMAYQTSETGGEGGAHQFGRSPNQSG